MPTFAMRWKCASYKSQWNILAFSEQWKMTSDLNISHKKISDFVWFPRIGFTLVLKLRNFDFESHTIICLKKYFSMFWYKAVPDSNMARGKMSDFASFPFFGFTLVIKLRNVDFESYGNTSIYFVKKDSVSDLNINMSHDKMSDFISFLFF